MLAMQLECEVISSREYNTTVAQEHKKLVKKLLTFKYKMYLEERKGTELSVPLLNIPEEESIVLTTASSTIVSIEQLIQKITDMYSSIDIPLPYILEDLDIMAEDVEYRSRFGLTAELLITLARLLNNPIERNAKWDIAIIKQNKRILLNNIGIPSDTIRLFLKSLRLVRRANGHNSYPEVDKNNLIIGINNLTMPNGELMKSATDTIAKLLNITYEFKVKPFGASAKAKFDRQEKIKLLKLDTELDDVIEKRKQLKALQSI